MNIGEEVKNGVMAALTAVGFKPNASNQQPEEHPVLAAALAAKIDSPEKFASLVSDAEKGRDLAAQGEPEPHPVQVAALAANIDDAQKFATLLAEAKAGREALSAARQEAEAAAIAYHGQNAEALQVAKDGLEGELNLATIKAKTEQFWALAPGKGQEGKRQSEGTAAPASDLASSNAASQKAPVKQDKFDYSAAGYNGPQANGKQAK